MSLQAMVWAFGVQKIAPTEKLLLMVLGNYAGDEWTCFPSQDTLASNCNMSSRSIYSWLGKLEEHGLIRRTPRYREGKGGLKVRTTDLILLRPAISEDPASIVPIVEGGGDHSRIEPQEVSPPVATLNHPPEPSNEPRATDVALAPKIAAASPERQAFNHWNDVAEVQGWKKAAVFNDVRKRHIAARLRECDGLPGWCDAITRCVASPFLSGRTPGRFVISLDFVLQPSSFTKLIEGFYDHRRPEPASGDPSGRAASHDRRTDAMLAGAASAFGAGSRNS